MRKLIFLFTATALHALAQAQSHDKDAQLEQCPMTLWYERPAQYFEESLPIGNGKMGALVYGDPDDDIIHLNDITLWTGKPIDREEGIGVASWIPEIRKALFHEDYARADSLQLHVQGHGSAYYQPLATLHIIDDNSQPMQNYRRELSLDSSLVKITYQRGHTRFSREYFASHPDQLIAVRLQADKPSALSCGITLTGQVPHLVKASNDSQLTMTGHAMGEAQETIHFCSILTVDSDGQQMATDSTLYIYGATEAVLYFVNETSFNGFDKHPVLEGADYLGRAADAAWHTKNLNYQQLRERHVKDYQRFYNRVKLRLGKTERHTVAGKTFNIYEEYESLLFPTDRLLRDHQTSPSKYLETLYFQYGRYLLISSSRTAGIPANLQGLWAPALWSPWRGNYTMNINLEENYWPAFVANLAEMAEPLTDFVKALSENGTHTARNFYGVTEGWCACHNSDIWAMTNPVGEHKESPMWANWNMGGAWLVNTLWERFLFTQDMAFLRTTAYPLMKGAADFCRQWLIENPMQQGELITAPSTSPENEYVTDQGYHGVTCYGGTADLAIIRELLGNSQQAARVCDMRDAAKSYESTLQRLHPYTIGQQGDLNEWYYDWRDYDSRHRHQSHLIGLFPGTHLTQPALLKACEQTLIQKGNETTGWSTGWRINLWARLQNGEMAYEIYRKLLTFTDAQDDQREGTRHAGGTYANLFDAHPPFQIDGNFGGTAGVCEMLLQSRLQIAPDGTSAASIQLLPALPKTWSSGAVQGLCARGGMEVDMQWSNGVLERATINSRTAQRVSVSYHNKTKTLSLKAGQSRTIKF